MCTCMISYIWNESFKMFEMGKYKVKNNGMGAVGPKESWVNGAIYCNLRPKTNAKKFSKYGQ